ncbi:hypothetical protein HPP92_016971 [Vanilla planifolia]|uniref:Uncharacterized protein n=1 Tax=Vanilla planifolia TaxID=51239 RepID=A0A835QBW1_VANPL|nr:hypothetical protein HPP92_016971 [Vanilla planifolia]
MGFFGLHFFDWAMALCFLKAVFFYPAAIARRSGPYTALQKLFAIRSLCGDAELR